MIKGFIGGFIIALVISIGASFWLFRHMDSQPFIFPPKTFMHLERDGGSYIQFSGVLTGRDMNGGTFVEGRCEQRTMRCEVTDISKIGPRQMSQFTVDEFIIDRWNNFEIVARSQPHEGACSRVVINILPSTEEVQYNRQPINPTGSTCSGSANELFRWTVESQPLWNR